MSRWAMFVDHLSRCAAALPACTLLGPKWLAVVAFYAIHPWIADSMAGKQATVGGMHLRYGESDAYIFANIVVDYDPRLVKKCLPQVQSVVDAGANIGAFAWLARQFDPKMEVIAIEPEPGNFALMQSQPLDPPIRALKEALGGAPGWCHIEAGKDAATARTKPSAADPSAVRVRTLGELVTKQTFLKLDIEGAEKGVLEAGLPPQIKFVYMEWHYAGSPESLVTHGRWKRIKQITPTESMWFWERDPTANQPFHRE